MLKKGLLQDILIFIIVVIFLLIVIPLISSILKHLIYLQIIIAIAGAIFLRILVQKIRRETRK